MGSIMGEKLHKSKAAPDIKRCHAARAGLLNINETGAFQLTGLTPNHFLTAQPLHKPRFYSTLLVNKSFTWSISSCVAFAAGT